MWKDKPFCLRFAVLDPNLIYNYCGPKTQDYIDRLNAENDFYNRLLKSVEKEGFRNPILVTSGHQGCPNIKVNRIPEALKSDLEKIVICDRNGGSRLWAAQQLGLPIPCIITDYTGRFDDKREIKTREELFACYTDRPASIRVNDHGVHVKAVPQVHLKKEDRPETAKENRRLYGTNTAPVTEEVVPATETFPEPSKPITTNETKSEPIAKKSATPEKKKTAIEVRHESQDEIRRKREEEKFKKLGLDVPDGTDEFWRGKTVPIAEARRLVAGKKPAPAPKKSPKKIKKPKRNPRQPMPL